MYLTVSILSIAEAVVLLQVPGRGERVANGDLEIGFSSSAIVSPKWYVQAQAQSRMRTLNTLKKIAP